MSMVRLAHDFNPSSPSDSLAAALHLNAVDFLYHSNPQAPAPLVPNDNQLASAWRLALPPTTSLAAYRKRLILDWRVDGAARKLAWNTYLASDEWALSRSYLEEIMELQAEATRLKDGWSKEKKRWDETMTSKKRTRLQSCGDDEGEQGDLELSDTKKLKRLRAENEALAEEVDFFHTEYSMAYESLHAISSRRSDPPPSSSEDMNKLQRRMEALESANIQMSLMLREGEAQRKANFQRKALVERLERARRKQVDGKLSELSLKDEAERLEVDDAATYIMFLGDKLTVMERELGSPDTPGRGGM